MKLSLYSLMDWYLNGFDIIFVSVDTRLRKSMNVLSPKGGLMVNQRKIGIHEAMGILGTSMHDIAMQAQT